MHKLWESNSAHGREDTKAPELCNCLCRPPLSRIRVPHGDRRTGSARLYLLTRSVGGVFVDELPVVRYKGPTGHAYRRHYTSAAGDVV